MHFINPTTPDALSVWATFVLTVPRISGAVRFDWYITLRRAATSIASPSAVPVPWHSTDEISAAETPESPNAPRSTACYALPEGEVSATDLPACCTSRPGTEAIMFDVSFCGGAYVNQRAPQPSARANPSAAASKVAQRPFADNSWAKYITKLAFRSLI